MVKPYFTRKNLIAIALTALYSLLFLFTGVCLTPGSGSVIAKDNPIMSIANTLGFKSITLEGVNGFVPLILVAFYIVIFAIALIYEGRFAKVNGKKVSAKKYNSYIKSLKGNAKKVKQSNIKLVRNTSSNRLKKLGYKK